jgi:spore coat protein U-like protein
MSWSAQGGSAVTMRSTFPVLTFGILASALAGRPVAAATASASISVTATVQASCVVSATATAFGTYAAAAANAASAVSVACSNSTPYNVSLSTAIAPGAAVAIQKMTGSGVALPGYAQRSNFRHIVNWGQPLGVDTAAGFGSSSAPVLAIHRRISAWQDVATGADVDTVTVVVTY